MFSVGDDPGTFVGTPHLLDGEGSEEHLAILSVKGPSTFNSRTYEV